MENILEKIKEKQDLDFLEKLQDSNIEIYAFGGLLRDIYLGRKWDDVDIRVVIPENREIRENILEKALSEYNLEGKTVIEDLDLTVYRFLPEKSTSKEPIDLSLVPSLEVNLPDFTINSLFFDLKNNEILDTYLGLEDLKAKVIRTAGNPGIRFQSEPHMMFRAIKFSCQIGFDIEIKTLEAIQINSFHIQNTFEFIKKQKTGIFVELFLGNIFKGLKSDPIRYFELINKTGLYKEFINFFTPSRKNIAAIQPIDFGSYEENISYLFSQIVQCSQEENKQEFFFKILSDLALSTPKEYSDFIINIQKLQYFEN